MSNIKSISSRLQQLASITLGSPAIGDDAGLALIDTILMTATLDQENQQAVFESTTSRHFFFSQNVSSKQMCALLEWLLDGELDSARKIVLCDATLYERALIGNMVPAASLRILCRLLFQVTPMCIIDLNQPESLSHILPRRQAGTHTSGQTTLSLPSARVLANVTAKIVQMTTRIRCLPLGFTSRYVWQTWIPGSLSLLLSTARSRENSIPMVMSIQNIYAIGLASALDFYVCTPAKQVISWVILGMSLGCEKFVQEYAALFYQDMVWLISRSTREDNNHLPPICTAKYESSQNKIKHYSRLERRCNLTLL
jgi:hypothetical protein